jgi:hypothetical protein
MAGSSSATSNLGGANSLTLAMSDTVASSLGCQ